MDLEAREIVKGKYWSVYRGKTYLGAIALRNGAYHAVASSVTLGYKGTLAEATELFRAFK